MGLRVEIEDAQPPRAGPVLVFSRHAGPWDSFLLVHALCSSYDRHARVVMKVGMQWDPVVDILGHRTSCRFIHPRGRESHRFIESIGGLARGLGPHEALVLFPEGGNYSDLRRRAGIQRLFQRGDVAHAEEALRMHHVIAPRPGGVMAAIAAAPEADVVFVAHTGLEEVATLSDLWRAVPLTRPVYGRYWRIPASAIPSDGGDQVDWLFDWWARIDRWIDDRHARI
jgi:1-acyl-sn-glycerol-3-phosphate acyltransferase